MTPSHAAELATVLAVLAQRGAVLVNVGHGRDRGSRRRVELFLNAWQATGGDLGAVVSWPPTAASWLRPANRLAAGAPDIWVVADTPTGWAAIGPRLAATGQWDPADTVAFSGLADPELPLRAGRAATEGMSGTTQNGTLWRFTNRLLHHEATDASTRE